MKNALKIYFGFLSVFFPKFAGRQAFELFQTPRNGKIRSQERPFFESAKKFTVKSAKEDIQCYEIGPATGSLVLLVHGWESNAGSLSGIGNTLAAKGYRIVSFNLPGHGFSRLKKSNLKVCTEAFLEVLTALAPAEKFSVISHSFGSAVTAYGLSISYFRANKLVFLTSPNRITDIFSDFAGFIGLGKNGLQAMIDHASKLLERPLEELNIQDLDKKISYEKLLIIHDENDKIINKKTAEAIQKKWARADLHLTKNAGHYRMVWNKEVMEKAVNFVDVTEAPKNIKTPEEALY